MKKILKKLFGKQSPLYAAIENGNDEEFCELFMNSDIFVLDADIGEGLPLDSSQDEILKQMETRAEELADKTASRIFTYKEDGKDYLPLFLSQNHADEFCGAFCGRENRLFAFQILQLRGTEVIEAMPHCDGVIMNDQSDDGYELSPEILSRLTDS